MVTHTRTIKRVVIEQFQTADGGGLGRHIEHDPKSRDFAYAAGAVTGMASLRRKRRIGPLDQANTGACTGESATGAQATAPFTNPLKARKNSQKVPLDVYHRATLLDGFPGTFPPDDSGSSGLAAAKALQQLRVITSYQHAFSLDAAVHAAANPGVVPIFGIGWYDSFDRPDANGVISISPGAQVRGGHEIQNDGIVLATAGNYSGNDLVWFWQSWGRWGLNDTGAFAMTVATLDRLLHEQGDCTILIP